MPYADYCPIMQDDAGSALRYAFQGQIHLERGDIDRVAKSFDKALALDPRCACVFSGRGMLFAKRGEYEHALKEYGRALKGTPSLSEQGKSPCIQKRHGQCLFRQTAGMRTGNLREFHEGAAAGGMSVTDWVTLHGTGNRPISGGRPAWEGYRAPFSFNGNTRDLADGSHAVVVGVQDSSGNILQASTREAVKNCGEGTVRKPSLCLGDFLGRCTGVAPNRRGAMLSCPVPRAGMVQNSRMPRYFCFAISNFSLKSSGMLPFTSWAAVVKADSA